MLLPILRFVPHSGFTMCRLNPSSNVVNNGADRQRQPAKRGAPCHSMAALSKADRFFAPNAGISMPHEPESQPVPMTITASAPLKGSVTVPGDKSISHRSLMLSALAIGESRVEGLLEGEDVLATAAALRAMGADIVRGDDGVWHIHGVGGGGLMEPETALDMGNSGTSTRLLMGLLASHDLTATFVGDASLSKRPMGRVTEPLSLMGAEFKIGRAHV